eukprot:gene44306-59105_t
MALHPKKIDLSLGRIETLLDKLGNPQRRLPPVIHVAGTNGKGSTIAFLRAALEAAGRRPHWRFPLEGKRAKWDDLARGNCEVDTASMSDAVLIRDPDGRLLGRGLVAYDAGEAALVLGKASRDIGAILGYPGRAEMIHRDDMALGVGGNDERSGAPRGLEREARRRERTGAGSGRSHGCARTARPRRIARQDLNLQTIRPALLGLTDRHQGRCIMPIDFDPAMPDNQIARARSLDQLGVLTPAMFDQGQGAGDRLVIAVWCGLKPVPRKPWQQRQQRIDVVVSMRQTLTGIVEQGAPVARKGIRKNRGAFNQASITKTSAPTCLPAIQ